jgi:hypothetical protein
MAQTLDKTFPCMTCGADIKLQRKDDDSGWNRFNLDGTVHVDAKKKSSPPTTQQQTGQLEAKIDTLITEVRALREEIAGKHQLD